MSCLNPDDLHRIFKKLDKNGDGLITLQQLKSLLDNIGCTTTTSLEDLQLLVGGYSLQQESPTTTATATATATAVDSLDSIDFFFFYHYFVNIKNNKTEQEERIRLDHDLVEAFKVFDLNGDGFISCDELRIVLLKFGLWDGRNDDECGNMIRMYDTNSDGLLDFEEFKNMMTSTTTTTATVSGGGC